MKYVTRQDIQQRASGRDPVKDAYDGFLLSASETMYILDFNKSTAKPAFHDARTFSFSFSLCPDGLSTAFKGYSFFIRLQGQNEYMEVGKISAQGRRHETGDAEDQFFFKIEPPLDEGTLAKVQTTLKDQASKPKTKPFPVAKALALVDTANPQAVEEFIRKLINGFDSNAAILSAKTPPDSLFGKWSGARALLANWWSARRVEHLEMTPATFTNGYARFMTNGCNASYEWALVEKDLSIAGRVSGNSSAPWSWTSREVGRFWMATACAAILELALTAECESEKSPSQIFGRKLTSLNLEFSQNRVRFFGGNGLLASAAPSESGFKYALASADAEIVEKFLEKSEEDWAPV